MISLHTVLCHIRFGRHLICFFLIVLQPLVWMFQFIFRLRGSPGVESGLLDPFRKNATPGAFLVYWICGFDVAPFVHVQSSSYQVFAIHVNISRSKIDSELYVSTN